MKRWSETSTPNVEGFRFAQRILPVFRLVRALFSQNEVDTCLKLMLLHVSSPCGGVGCYRGRASSSRIEARHAHAEKIYLGREALGRRAKELEAELAGLDEADASAHEQDETLKVALKKLDEQIEAQRARRAWSSSNAEIAAVTGSRIDGA